MLFKLTIFPQWLPTYTSRGAMEIQRQKDHSLFYVDVTERATLICPHCHKQKVLPAGAYRDITTPLQVNCGCGNTFRVLFEFRKNFIKKVNLEGAYEDTKTGETGNIVVTHLSIEGAGFRTTTSHSIRHGQALNLHFTLDNKIKTPVDRAFKVTSVKNDLIGGMFVGTLRNKTVGFYLMP